MRTENVSIVIGTDETVSGIITHPENHNENSTTGLVFAHGASNDMNHPSITAICEGLVNAGFVTLRFNFPYREKGRKSPDSPSVLIRTWGRAIEFLQKKETFECERLIAVGKSLGARIASIAVAEEQIEPDALIFLGYPLHAPGKKHLLKDAHLYGIDIPMLFFEGTRDPFCDLNLLSGVLKNLKCPHELEIIEGGNHSFHLPKADPRCDEDVYEQIIERCLTWLASS